MQIKNIKSFNNEFSLIRIIGFNEVAHSNALFLPWNVWISVECPTASAVPFQVQVYYLVLRVFKHISPLLSSVVEILIRRFHSFLAFSYVCMQTSKYFFYRRHLQIACMSSFRICSEAFAMLWNIWMSLMLIFLTYLESWSAETSRFICRITVCCILITQSNDFKVHISSSHVFYKEVLHLVIVIVILCGHAGWLSLVISRTFGWWHCWMLFELCLWLNGYLDHFYSLTNIP